MSLYKKFILFLAIISGPSVYFKIKEPVSTTWSFTSLLRILISKYAYDKLTNAKNINKIPILNINFLFFIYNSPIINFNTSNKKEN